MTLHATRAATLLSWVSNFLFLRYVFRKDVYQKNILLVSALQSPLVYRPGSFHIAKDIAAADSDNL